MPSKIALAGAGVITSVALLAGCGGSTSSSTAASSSSSAGTAAPGGQAASGVPDKPCSLVTKAEAEAIMGVSIDEPVLDAAINTCSYNAVAGVPGQTKVAFYANGKALYDRLKGNQPALTGVGDAAVCDPAAGSLTTVVNAKDLVIGVVSTDCDKAKAFALKILSRL